MSFNEYKDIYADDDDAGEDGMLLYICEDMLIGILDFLGPAQLLILRHVCKTWNSVISTRYEPYSLCKFISRCETIMTDAGKWPGRKNARAWWIDKRYKPSVRRPWGEPPLVPFPSPDFIRNDKRAVVLIGGTNDFRCTSINQLLQRLMRDAHLLE